MIIHQRKTKKITTVKKVWIPRRSSVILISKEIWRFYVSFYSLVFVSIEKVYQTLESLFHMLSKHLKFRQKYSAARCIFNSFIGVWKSKWNTTSRVWYISSQTELWNLKLSFVQKLGEEKRSLIFSYENDLNLATPIDLGCSSLRPYRRALIFFDV